MHVGDRNTTQTLNNSLSPVAVLVEKSQPSRKPETYKGTMQRHLRRGPGYEHKFFNETRQ